MIPDKQNIPEEFVFQPEPVRGKCVLITGGTTGIGRATALLLASQGARVMIFGRNQEELEVALNDIRQSNPEAYGFTADVSRPDDIQRIFEQVDQQFGSLDVLINNAALGAKATATTSYEDMQHILQVNLLGYMGCVHEAVKRMQKNAGGHIVNIGSMSADEREKDSSVYVATKAGIQGFSEALRKELNPQGIKVTLIEPGAVGTDMQPETPGKQLEQQKEMKMLMAEDIALAVLFCLVQPKRSDVVVMQIRPHLQLI